MSVIRYTNYWIATFSGVRVESSKPAAAGELLYHTRTAYSIADRFRRNHVAHALSVSKLHEYTTELLVHTDSWTLCPQWDARSIPVLAVVCTGALWSPRRHTVDPRPPWTPNTG